jgi:hypothetical protein
MSDEQMGEEEMGDDDKGFHDAAHAREADPMVLVAESNGEPESDDDASESDDSGEDADIHRSQRAPYPTVTAFLEGKELKETDKKADHLVVRWDPTAPAGADCLVHEFEIRIGSVVQCLVPEGPETNPTWATWLIAVSELCRQKGQGRKKREFAFVGRDVWYVHHAHDLGTVHNEDGTKNTDNSWVPLKPEGASDPLDPTDPTVIDWCLVLDTKYDKDIVTRTYDIKLVRKTIPIYKTIKAAQHAEAHHHPVRPYALPSSFVMNSQNKRTKQRFKPFKTDNNPSNHVTYEEDR